MKTENIYIGNSEAHFEAKNIDFELVTIEHEYFFKIMNVDNMKPFFMSIVSDSNHWFFISSNGGLSAGRKNSDMALFPYYTVDKIIESTENTGCKTLLIIEKNNKKFLWQPFSDNYKGIYKTERNLYKNIYGNSIIFEEKNFDLNLIFKYQWCTSNVFGFVRLVSLHNQNDSSISVSVLDGIQNLIPAGISSNFQNEKSCLIDAYKKNELISETGLGIYCLSAFIVDKPEPSESLKATTAWSLGFEESKKILSAKQVDNFAKGFGIEQETDVRAERGAYFINADFAIEKNSTKNWQIVANVNQNHADIALINSKLANKSKLFNELITDIKQGTKKLNNFLCAADGLQITNNMLSTSRHLSNVLFNIMRGGIFDNNYIIDKHDFTNYVAGANWNIYTSGKDFFDQLPEQTTYSELKKLAKKFKNANYERLCNEYLPLKFSRRHGDPSRPWNMFSIELENEDGSKVLNYEGNWRDIFQNWEAMSISYPEFLFGMIAKFLNASTFDGYNPYRITKNGFDWEVLDPHDPWSYIGYWGDHQIIYLLKLLEITENHYPQQLESYFAKDIFVYANVPYKIKSYQALLNNPKDTIIFDHALNKELNSKAEKIGSDGKLLTNRDQTTCKANLIEKLLAILLAKFSNFIPEAGIWLNTQRPEWNDANNALVGNGASMVTLYYMRRFQNFFIALLQNSPDNEFAVSTELESMFRLVVKTFVENREKLSLKMTDTDRKTILDGLGNAGSYYRYEIYENGFSGNKKALTKAELLMFCEISIEFLDHSIKANKREDNLYHAYNLIEFKNNNEISIETLPEMLEGQVAVLSSGYLSSPEALHVLDALKNSALFRSDQYSYLLYPDKQLPRFVDKNIIPKKTVEKSKLISQLISDHNKDIVIKDITGEVHFNGNFKNANNLKHAFDKLPTNYSKLIVAEKDLLLNTFEQIFNHKSFTGRSGTFYGYEGLGSIYWHMVSKLLLAVNENFHHAVQNKEDNETIGHLKEHYYEIRAGIGINKSPELYGAFPTDPYSHTPGNSGAQQPGMTGQVKEDILNRFGELGVFVKNGCINFVPNLLHEDEFLKQPKQFLYTTVNNVEQQINLETNTLCFTYCQVPIIYKLSNCNKVIVSLANGEKIINQQLQVDKIHSAAIFARNSEINKIEVEMNF